MSGNKRGMTMSENIKILNHDVNILYAGPVNGGFYHASVLEWKDEVEIYFTVNSRWYWLVKLKMYCKILRRKYS